MNFQRNNRYLSLLVFVATTFILNSCGADKPNVVSDVQGLISMEVPSSWSKRTDLNAAANLQAGNPFNEEYLVVISEAKEDLFQMNLQRYATFSIQNLRSSAIAFEMEQAKPVEINGMKGLKYICRGVIENVKISYMITLLESEGHYHNVMMWTLRSKENEAFPKFETALLTFKELVKSANEAPAK
ncbi:MAG: hypothetical protein F9K24_00880 [Leptonema illini]|uniref:Uncharacterized protein n=1 Tax=Leptonema illini TaxID=183 RepID=A0A833LYW8_9LEPT|nr:MAG: hypothetical protein F9K24_00880 [Leptonema illini]